MTLVTVFLHLFWAFCALAAAILLALVTWRCWANFRVGVRHRERGHFIDVIKAWADRPAGDVPALADDVSTDLTVEILEFLRGDEKQRLAARATEAGVAATLHRRLRKGNARRRILAAAALGNFRDEPTHAALLEALDDATLDVRLTAALSLGKNGQAPPPEKLIRRIGLYGSDATLLVGLVLFRIAQSDPASVRSLLLDVATRPSTRAASAGALARVNDFAAVPIITQLALQADHWASELPHYLEAIGDLGHPAGTPAVLQGLDSRSTEVRAAAARAAGRIVALAALPRLERLLGDPDWWVRFHAARALLQLDSAGETLLRRAALRVDEPARETAVLTLAEQEDAA